MRKSSLKSNLLFNIVYQAAATMMPLVTAPYISRIIGADGLGEYSFYHSIAQYFVYFSMLGILNYANRAISKEVGSKDMLERRFSSIYWLQLAISSIISLAYFVFLILCVKGSSAVPYIMSLHVLSAVFDVSWLFFGIQDFKTTSIIQLISKSATFAALFIFVHDKNELWVYTLIMSMGYFATAISLWVLARRRISLVKCKVSDVVVHLKPCLLLFIPIIANSVFYLMDKIMIGELAGIRSVGYYENAEKLIFVSSSILGAISSVAMPKISNLIARKKDIDAKKVFGIVANISMLLSFAIAFGIASISNEFIPVYFGEGFSDSISITILLCVSLPFLIWSMTVRNMWLIPHENDKIYVKSVVLSAGINLIANYTLIPIMGANGAAIGTIVANICLSLFQSIPIRKQIAGNRIGICCLLYIISGVAMTVAIRLLASFALPGGLISVCTEIVIGAILYSGISIMFFVIFSGITAKELKAVMRS